MTKHMGLILLLLGLINSNLYAQEIKVGFHDFPPMMIKHSNSGIYKEIFAELTKRTGDTYTILYSSAARINEQFIKGDVDIEPGIAPIWRAHTSVPGVFSESFKKSEVILLFAPGNAFAYTGVNDLIGKEIGAVRGYHYSGFGDLISTGKIKRVDSVSEEHLIKFLGAGRIGVILIEKSVALFHMSQNMALRNLQPGSVYESADIAMRVHPSKKHILTSMNKALSNMKRQGVIDEIYLKYQ